MSSVFLKLLNMSITASWLILAVILVRLFLKKAPKWISCVLWALVAVRLVFPFSPESVMSLIPSSETIPADIGMMTQPAIHSGVPVINSTVNPIISGSFRPDPSASANPLQIIIPVLSVVWIVGMIAMLLYALISFVRLKKSVAASIPVKDRILVCDEVKSPFILGIIRPMIYVPSSMEGETLDHVIRHETAHIGRHDHWWKPLGYLILTVYWFNPLCWLAYILLCRDIEMSCDEKVIGTLSDSDRVAYSQALLNCSFPRKRIAACPLAFGEVGVKERVRSVLNYKKPTFWIIIAAVVVCIAVIVCFMTDPAPSDSLSDKLKVSMDTAVADHYHFSPAPENFIAADYEVLGVEEKKGKTTVYAWVYCAEYSFDGSDVTEKSASHIPTAITFDTSEDGDTSSYDVIEYWEPRDGSYYSDDIRSKFPSRLRSKVFDVSDAEKQSEKCLQDAREYFAENSNVPLQSPSVTEWFDYFDCEKLPWDSVKEITLDEFPGVTFRCDLETLEAVTDGETDTLCFGMPILNVFFCDLNGDGKPELCSSVVFGSGICDEHIVVCDYANETGIYVWDRGIYDYTLKLQDEKLIVEKNDYREGELLDSGELVFRDGNYQIIWDSGEVTAYGYHIKDTRIEDTN